MSWVTAVGDLLLACAVLALLAFAWMMLRRRLIARRGAVFDCSVRLSTTTPGSGWVLGVARYSGEWLEWYRLVDLALAPRLRWERARTVVVGQRAPSAVEAVVLRDGQQVAELEQRRTDRSTVEVAMAPEALTGLLSWLEAAPPGVGRYGSVAD